MYAAVKVLGTRETQEGHTQLIIDLGEGMGEKVEKALRKGATGELRLDDGRSISADQRKKIYATIADIAKHAGMTPEEAKDVMKYYFEVKTGMDDISFAHGKMDMTTASHFIEYLMEFVLGYDIPLSNFGIDRVDDGSIGKYIFYCLKHQKCTICGKKGEMHHVDAIGMGSDRTTVDDSKARKIELCRECHSKAHNMGWERFAALYKIFGILFDQKKERINKKKLDEYKQAFDYIYKGCIK